MKKKQYIFKKNYTLVQLRKIFLKKRKKKKIFSLEAPFIFDPHVYNGSLQRDWYYRSTTWPPSQHLRHSSPKDLNHELWVTFWGNFLTSLSYVVVESQVLLGLETDVFVYHMSECRLCHPELLNNIFHQGCWMMFWICWTNLIIFA